MNLQHRIPQQHLATAGGIGALLFWSLTIALARRISEQVGPISGATCVYTVSAVFGVAGMLRSREQRRQITQLPLAYLLGCGFLFVSYMLPGYIHIGIE